MVFTLMTWLAVGGLIGWLVSTLLRTKAREVLLLNAFVGMVGALLAGWLVAPLIVVTSMAAQALPPLDAVAVASLGAVALLLIANGIPFIIRRRRLQ